MIPLDWDGVVRGWESVSRGIKLFALCFIAEKVFCKKILLVGMKASVFPPHMILPKRL